MSFYELSFYKMSQRPIYKNVFTVNTQFCGGSLGKQCKFQVLLREKLGVSNEKAIVILSYINGGLDNEFTEQTFVRQNQILLFLKKISYYFFCTEYT